MMVPRAATLAMMTRPIAVVVANGFEAAPTIRNKITAAVTLNPQVISSNHPHRQARAAMCLG